jgi:ABC-type Fe3+/spermidine/putrescine transport system ATPase subunit
MSDRIAVMSEGLVQQVGTPREIYEEPETTFVADFLGVSNLMSGQADGRGHVRIGEVDLTAARGDVEATGEVQVTIRPERVRLESLGTAGENRLQGVVNRMVYLGPTTQVLVELAHGDMLQASVQGGGEAYREGSPVTVSLPPEGLRVLRRSDAELGELADR